MAGLDLVVAKNLYSHPAYKEQPEKPDLDTEPEERHLVKEENSV